MYRIKFIKDSNKDTLDINKLIRIKQRPFIPFAEEIVESTSLANKTTLYRHTSEYYDRNIKIECSFIQNDRTLWMDQLSKIQQHLIGSSGKLILQDDDSNHYWIVKKVELDGKKRTLGIIGDFTLTFVCEPYRYLLEYAKPLETSGGSEIELYNPFHESCPIYRFYNTADKSSELVVINNGEKVIIRSPFFSFITGKKVKYAELNINTMCYMQTYEDDSTYDATILTDGNFEGLKLQNGLNLIEANSDVGKIRTDIYRRYREL